MIREYMIDKGKSPAKNDCIMFSVDSSTKKTGISIFVNGDLWKCLLVDCSSIKNMDERFPEMCRSIILLFMEYRPYIVYIEETVVNRNVSTQRFLTRIQGAVYAWCIFNDCEFNTVRPTEWRKTFNFNSADGKRLTRDQLKEEAVKYIQSHFNISVNDDIAESICIGLHAMENFKRILAKD